jgi:hypothetical protein
VSRHSFRIARAEDYRCILAFLGSNWDTRHIYVKVPHLFLYDFYRHGQLNIGLLELDDKIEGIFGFFFYNESTLPDLGGMLWRVSDNAQRIIPMAGFALRDFVLRNVPHRFFGAPGAGLDTKVIYDCLGSRWLDFSHFVVKVSGSNWPDFVRIRGGDLIDKFGNCGIKRLVSTREVLSIPNCVYSHANPRKDSSYILWKYVHHPFHSYSLWLMEFKGSIALVVCRIQRKGGALVLRVVDYLGENERIPIFLSCLLRTYSKTKKVAYLDIVGFGLPEDLLLSVGFASVDFQNHAEVVPNYFDPFVPSSLQIFGNCYEGFGSVRMLRGDGDQDRPNSLSNWEPS